MFLNREEALLFVQLMITPEEKAGKVYDAECVFVDTATGKY